MPSDLHRSGVPPRPRLRRGPAAEASARLAQKRTALRALLAERAPYIREMAEDLLQCDDTPAYYDFGTALFVSGARATLAERVPAQSRV